MGQWLEAPGIHGASNYGAWSVPSKGTADLTRTTQARRFVQCPVVRKLYCDDDARPSVSGPERAVGRQASGLPPSLTQKPSPSGDGSSQWAAELPCLTGDSWLRARTGRSAQCLARPSRLALHRDRPQAMCGPQAQSLSRYGARTCLMMQLHEVHAHYGSAHALHGVSLAVEAGQIACPKSDTSVSRPPGSD